ncbi:MAG: hypothetical protein MI974_01145 [Chitinophagales bacterium]|nr:hypothetical protein [Chitinophagales bacterium]
MIVFNPEGMIVKSFAPENHKGIHLEKKGIKFHTFLIEKVPPEDLNKYFLIYQYRINDKNHEPGIINIDEEVHIRRFETNGRNDEILTCDIGKSQRQDYKKFPWYWKANHRKRDIISYALVKMNLPEGANLPESREDLLIDSSLLNSIKAILDTTESRKLVQEHMSGYLTPSKILNEQQQDRLFQQYKKLLEEEDRLLEQQDKLFERYKKLLEEQDTLLTQQDTLLTQQDTLLTQQDTLLTQQRKFLKKRLLQKQRTLPKKQKRLLKEQKRFLKKQKRLLKEQKRFLKKQKRFLKKRLLKEQERLLKKQRILLEEQKALLKRSQETNLEDLLKSQERLMINYAKSLYGHENFLRKWIKATDLYSRQTVTIYDLYKWKIFADISIENIETVFNYIDAIHKCEPIVDSLKSEKENSVILLRLLEDSLQLNKELLRVYEKRAEQLAENTYSQYHREITNEIVKRKTRVVQIENEITKIKSRIDEICVENRDSIIKKITNSTISKEFDFYLDRFPVLKLKVVDVLHVGYAIENSHQTKEVIYEVDQDDLEHSNKDELTFARQTPSLPLLTTDDRLFLKVVNLKPDLLESNPFFLGITIDQEELAAEWEIANGPKVKVIEGNPLDNLKGFPFGKEAKWSRLAGAPEDVNAIARDPNRKKAEYFNKVFLYLKKDKVPVGTVEDFYYWDYLLRIPNSFKYRRKPSITLTVNSLEEKTDEKKDSQKEESTPPKPSSQKVFVDTFDPVRTRYAFAITTGVMFSEFTSVRYDSILLAGTVDKYFLEESKVEQGKFVFGAFLSFFPIENDIYSNRWKPMSKLHIDVGIDIETKNLDLFDNIYLGLGIQLHQYIHIGGGWRFGSYKEADLSKLASNSLDISGLLKSKREHSFYFGIQFGYNFL